ncbi:transcriptional regulator [Longispora fulva]|uniref:Transcriptional regulator with XRE-family HTH domain n=1 Tax=Longispora fulva TaxID=619741 RepID=A0A8J7GDP4_9ACTN|nr:helix-turn-helix transcriptional regulator [Longispora fulva]MBG6134587.1 transcriptional regulator with XRE-family HTH domain [Longispora fulva]GIG61793.1 transcriptional regulator [Longispora fulva]
MANPQSPSVYRRILASELRRLRSGSGLTQAQAEEAAGIGETSLSRYENGTNSMSIPVAEKLLTLYGEKQPRLGQLLELVKASRRRGGGQGLRGIIPTWFEDLVALERDASTVQQFALRVVPGYLQTERYARAVLSGGLIREDVERHVQARMARTLLLDGDEPFEYWVVLCESALRVLVGGRDVMREQLEHVAEMARRPNVTIQVLPDSHGAHASMNTEFQVLSFAIAPEFAVVYMDYPTGSLYLDVPTEVEPYHRAYTHLIKAALSDVQSLDMIKARAEELT